MTKTSSFLINFYFPPPSVLNCYKMSWDWDEYKLPRKEKRKKKGTVCIYITSEVGEEFKRHRMTKIKRKLKLFFSYPSFYCS